MQQKQKFPEPVVEQVPAIDYVPSRRKFLAKLTGAAAITAVAAACNKEADFRNGANLLDANDQRKAAGQALDMGEGDIAILNFAYLLEQLDSTFYQMVTDNFFTGIRAYNKERFRQLRDHEIAHREFLKTALGDLRIPDLEFDFSMVDFSSKQSVVTHAILFEDTGVAALNGAGQYLENPEFLLIAGKMVSVEARHASFLRSLNQPDSFANSEVVDMNGLDLAKSPDQVAEIIAPFIKTSLDFSKLRG